VHARRGRAIKTALGNNPLEEKRGHAWKCAQTRITKRSDVPGTNWIQSLPGRNDTMNTRKTKIRKEDLQATLPRALQKIQIATCDGFEIQKF